MDAPGRPISSRPTPATRSENGSTRTAAAASICWKWKRGPFQGPRAYDATGLPLHFDNQSIFKERFYLDKTDPNILHDMITVIDDALTRPWTVDKTYRRNTNPRPTWREFYCVEGNVHIVIGKENYYLGADGLLMPTKKDQAPPDLRYFKQSRK
jgi:hypothetical protein